MAETFEFRIQNSEFKTQKHRVNRQLLLEAHESVGVSNGQDSVLGNIPFLLFLSSCFFP